MDGQIFITKHIGDIEGIADKNGNPIPGIKLIDVIMQAQEQSDATRYTIHINSIGGSVSEAEKIINYLSKLSLTKELIAINEGVVASAASKIYMSIGRRSSVPGAKILLHNPMGGIRGNSSDIESYASELKKIEKEYQEFYAQKLNMDKDTVKDLMVEDFWIDYEKANKLGIVNYSMEEVNNPQEEIIFAAITNTNKNESNMNEQEKTSLFKAIDEIKAFFTSKKKEEEVQALAVMTNEGFELNFPSDIPAEGDSVTAPDGTYTFVYGDKSWVAVVENNTVVSLTEQDPEAPAEDPEMEALKQENESLKKQIEEITANHSEAVETVKGEIATLKKYVEEHKAIQSTEDPEPNPETKFEQPKADPIQARIQEGRERAAELKKKRKVT